MDTELKDALDEILDGTPTTEGEEGSSANGNLGTETAAETTSSEGGTGSEEGAESQREEGRGDKAAEQGSEGKEGGEGSGEGGETVEEQLARLKAELAEREREKKGLLQTLTHERGKRQHFEGRFSQLSDTVTGLINKREEAKSAEKPKGDDGATADPDAIEMVVTEDGRILLPKSKIAEVVKPLEENVAKSIKEIRAEEEYRQAERRQAAEYDALVKGVVGDSEDKAQAHEVAEKAYGWFVNLMTTYARNSNMDRLPNSEETLNLLESKGETVLQKFQEEFPGVDYERVLRMKDSTASFRRAVHSIADVITAGKKNAESAKSNGTGDTPAKDAKPAGMPGTLKKLVDKPSSLASSRNQKTTATLSFKDMLERIPKDPLELSDADVKALREANRQEELRG